MDSLLTPRVTAGKLVRIELSTGSVVEIASDTSPEPDPSSAGRNLNPSIHPTRRYSSQILSPGHGAIGLVIDEPAEQAYLPDMKGDIDRVATLTHST